MDFDHPAVPNATHRGRRGSHTLGVRLARALPGRNVAGQDWLLFASVVVSFAVVAIALYYTR